MAVLIQNGPSSNGSSRPPGRRSVAAVIHIAAAIAIPVEARIVVASEAAPAVLLLLTTLQIVFPIAVRLDARVFLALEPVRIDVCAATLARTAAAVSEDHAIVGAPSRRVDRRSGVGGATLRGDGAGDGNESEQ